ncbi:MAG: oligosaccharide flippase family protein [Janthinobacterium sp.]
MSLKKNILANYVGQIYVTLIGILLVPLYVKYMGAEAYGLVGFYAMLQGWFQLLDVGLTPTMARETSRFRGGAIDALSLRRLLRALEGFFALIAIICGGAMMLGANFIASTWLNVQELPLHEVRNAVLLIGMIVALRWVCGLYRGAINGFEHLVWLNGFNISIATLRFAFIIPFLIYVGASPTYFFSYQLVVAIIEVFVLVVQTYRIFPKSNVARRLSWQWEPLRSVLKFSLTVAFTSAVWIFITQTDKLILSKLLLLSDYAYFTLGVLVASGVSVISGPISGALLPRLTKLNAAGDDNGTLQLYRNATQMVCAIAIPTALTLAFFSEQVLWAWTGNATVVSKAAPILSLYALGNGILALAAFPYYLQYAKGDLKLHLVGNALFVVFLIPLLIFSTLHFGAIGAGYAWVTANALYFFAWIPKVHQRFASGLHMKWLLKDISGIVFLTTVCAAFLRLCLVFPEDRLHIGFLLAGIGLLILSVAVVASPFLRNKIHDAWRIRFSKLN